MVKDRPLKLRARDLDDMTVMAAMLQDAVVRPAEMTYLARDKRFVMVISRFRWEDPEVKTDALGAEPPESKEDGEAVNDAAKETDGEAANDAANDADSQEDARFEDAGPRPLYGRVNAGLCFEYVRRVRTQKLDLKDKDQVLSLLTVEAQPRTITLVFSGGALVRLDVDSIACFLEDLGEPWPTPWVPLHETGEGEGEEVGTGEPGAGQ